MNIDFAMQKIKSEKHFGCMFVDSPSLRSICSTDSVFVASELKTSLGVPDYVLLAQQDYQSILDFTNNYSTVRLSGNYAAVVSYVAKNDTTCVRDIAKLLGKQRSSLLKPLRELQEWGVIDFTDSRNCDVKLRHDFLIPNISSIAIELKLSSWEKALWQACRNRSQFASSYVVMPSNKLDLLNSKVDLFKSNDISTAVYNVDSMEFTSLHKNKHNMLVTNRYYLEAIDSIINNLSTFRQITF